MSDKSFTFFELHFHDGFQFGPKSLGQGDQPLDEATTSESGDASGEDTTEPDDGAEESSGCLGCKLLGLGVLAAAAYAVRKLLSDPSGLDALDDIEELDEFGNGGNRESDGSDEAADAEGEDDAVAIEVTSGEESTSGHNTGLLVAAAVTLLLLLAFAAKKLLGGDVEEIEIPDELAEE